jgi:hypothetical protein
VVQEPEPRRESDKSRRMRIACLTDSIEQVWTSVIILVRSLRDLLRPESSRRPTEDNNRTYSWTEAHGPQGVGTMVQEIDYGAHLLLDRFLIKGALSLYGDQG